MSNGFVPNSFQTPNAIIDELWLYLEPEEKDLLMIAIRHILGWQESISTRTAYISTSRFMKYTVLGRNSVLAALESLHQFGILSRVGNATSKGQQWKLTFDQAGAVQWDALKSRLEQKRSLNRSRGERLNRTGTMQVPVPSRDSNQSLTGTGTGPCQGQNQTHRIKHTTQTQNTSSEPADAGPDDPPQRPSPVENPEAYSVPEIQALKLTRSDWEQLLRNERLGRGKYGVRSGVVNHIERKLNMHPLEPLMPAMLEAVDKATVQSLYDPDMAARFRRVIYDKLWQGDRPYLPDEILQFAAEESPVENVHFLPSVLSSWRGKQKAKGKASNGSQPQGEKKPKYPQYNRNDALERIEQRKRAAAEAAAAGSDSSPGV